MKEFFKKLNEKLPKFAKIGGIVLAVIVLLAIAYRLAEPVFNQVFRTIQPNTGYQSFGIDYDDEAGYYNKTISSYDSSMDGYAIGEAYDMEMAPVTSPGTIPLPPHEEVVTGDDAEDYEITQYNATIETRNLEETCSKITELKVLDYVIFENSNEYDHGCDYTFKVTHEKSDEILAKIKDMEPKDFSENTYTIKKRIENITNEVEILENKKLSIETTLEEAISAYDEIAALATRTQDVESLTKIIDSKLQIIERLTQERININERLDRLAKSKVEQLDRLEYTYFYVNVFENKYIDGEELKDSWKMTVKNFVRDVNALAQDISINLVFLLLLAFQYGLYLLILLILVKYGWRLGKYIWKK